MEKHSLVRTIYLYLFALVGLALITVGGVRFVDMGLKAFVFTQAEQEERIRHKYPPMLPIQIERYEENKEITQELTSSEKQAIKNWMEDYKRWQEEESRINYLTVKRHREASQNLAFILIGLPLYLYHWRIIKRETKNKKGNKYAKR